MTGEYLVPPFDPGEVERLLPGREPEAGMRDLLRRIAERLGLETFGPTSTRVDEVGWGVLLPEGKAGIERRARLKSLLDFRLNEAGPQLFKTFTYLNGADSRTWLREQDVGVGVLDPTKVPYFLLLAGGPDEIPFSFESLLGTTYAVGRLSFDGAHDYERYAKAVVDHENASVASHSREIVFWGPRFRGDKQTQLSEEHLVRALYSEEPTAVAAECGYTARCISGPAATRQALLDVVHPCDDTGHPAVLFAASHGLGFEKGAPEQRMLQGALVCQDADLGDPLLPGQYFGAESVDSDVRVAGSVAFLFACFSNGTPTRHRYQMPVANHTSDPPFVAALPRALLSHRHGPALAVVGHVDRAWSYSIQPPGVRPSIAAFRSCLKDILSGLPVGHALRAFSNRFASLSAEIAEILDPTSGVKRPAPRTFARLWLERNDLAGYVLLGDPAARLRPNLMPAQAS